MERYAFFLNNRCNLLAESNEEKNILSGFRSGAVVKTITESQFLNARNLKSELILNEGIVEEVLIDDQLFLNNPEKNLQEAKDKIKNTIAIFLPLLEQYCNSHENDTYWHDYKKKLEDINVDSLSFPLEYETFQEWFNSQPNYPQKSLLQCP